MRIAVLGNAGSGKSTLAAWLARSAGLAVLDLDTVAWEPDQPAVARADAHAEADVVNFCSSHATWVVEGCYGHLVDAALRFDPVLVFLDPGLESCTTHCLGRPWEPHKYASQQEQDANLQTLLSWVREYYSRDGHASLAGHRAIFNEYPGRKVAIRHVLQLNPPEAEALALLR